MSDHLIAYFCFYYRHNFTFPNTLAPVALKHNVRKKTLTQKVKNDHLITLSPITDSVTHRVRHSVNKPMWAPCASFLKWRMRADVNTCARIAPWPLSSWCRHQMENFPRYWPFVRGIHRSPVNSPHKGQWRAALMFSLICVWINGWINNREAGDLRRNRVHYDVTVMLFNLRSV